MQIGSLPRTNKGSLGGGSSLLSLFDEFDIERESVRWEFVEEANRIESGCETSLSTIYRY